jgi:hypothetical protein
MTGWRALLEYQAAGLPSRMRRVFIKQFLRITESRIFCGLCAKGHLFSRIRLKQVPEYVHGKLDSQSQIQGNHHNKSTEIESSLFIADNQTSLVQSNQRACLAQTGDE